jgi:hypothetical protein
MFGVRCRIRGSRRFANSPVAMRVGSNGSRPRKPSAPYSVLEFSSGNDATIQLSDDNNFFAESSAPWRG